MLVKSNDMTQIEIKQRKIQSSAFIIAMGIAICFSVYFVVSSFCQMSSGQVIQLDEQINPNNATVASLMRLPGIGIVRAEAIVAYRENFAKQEESSSMAFQDCNDLQKVRGIGPKTVQNIKSWLKFK